MSKLKVGDKVNYIGKGIQIRAGNPWIVSDDYQGERDYVRIKSIPWGSICHVAPKNLIKIEEQKEPFAYVKTNTDTALTLDDFNNLISEAIEQMKSTLITKGKDYGRNDDPLASFNDYNAITKMTVFQAWSILVSKHFQSIMNAIHANPELPTCSAEHINERIKDIANYCLLFIPLYEQELRKHGIKKFGVDISGNPKEGIK